MMSGVMVYLEDIAVAVKVLNAESIGKVLLALCAHVSGTDAPELSQGEQMLYAMMCTKVDRDMAKYAAKAAAGQAGGSKPKQTQANESKSKQTQANPSKPKQTEAQTPLTSNLYLVTSNEYPVTEIVTTTDGGAGAREETPFGEVIVDPLIVKAQRELLGLTDTHYDLLGQYRAELGDELVSHAIDEAVANGVRKWAYVETILSKWQSSGIRTVAEAKAADERRKAKGRDAPKTVHAQRFTQRSYTDEQLEGEMSPLLAEAMARIKKGDQSNV